MPKANWCRLFDVALKDVHLENFRVASKSPNENLCDLISNDGEMFMFYSSNKWSDGFQHFSFRLILLDRIFEQSA